MRAFCGAVLLLLGCRSGPFVCEQDDDCSGGNGGVCEPSGWCSFFDEACPSGRRYGKWAGDGLAHECVTPGDASTASEDSSSDPSGATVGDPTTLTSMASTTVSTSADTFDTTSPVDPDSSSAGDPTDATTDDVTTGPPLDEDLVLWYRFEDDAFAGTVIDEVGAHEGACVEGQCPVSTEGPVGKAADFDGLDDFVLVAAHPDLQVQSELTVAAWVRFDGIDSEFQTLAAKAYLDQNADTWELGLGGLGSLQFGVTNDQGVHVGLGQPVGEPGTWRHIAGTWDGANVRLYLDGSLVEVGAAAGVAQDDHGVTLGGGFDLETEDNHLDGALDEFRLYRRALGDAEIAELATP